MRGQLNTGWTRRACLQALGGLWIGLRSTPARSNEATASLPGFGRAKSVIFLVANGGQSQLDTWDPKPEAPTEIRGAFSSIETAVPGTRICEHLPRMAAIADKYAIVRTMCHEDLDHGSALYLTLTGRYHARRSSNPPPQPNDWPMHGAIVKRIRGVQTSLDAAVTVNGPAQIPINIGPGQSAGLLGTDFDPLLLGDVTAQPTVLPGLSALPALNAARRHRRDDLLRSLEHTEANRAPAPAYSHYDVLSNRARDLLDRPEVCHALDIDREPESLRSRYGLDRSGQACLLARRLVEASVPWITVFWNHSGRGQDLAPQSTTEYGWDTHNDIFVAMRDRLLPRFDQSVSALLNDLDERGLLDETLVVVAGEFGRAPLVALEKNFVGESPGRKHWGFCYSIVLAGAGVVPGQVIGSSDSRGAYPITEPYGPWDLAATMYSAMGIDPSGHFTDRLNRPLTLTEGRVMSALYER